MKLKLQFSEGIELIEGALKERSGGFRQSEGASKEPSGGFRRSEGALKEYQSVDG
jgi:hypothetical protein